MMLSKSVATVLLGFVAVTEASSLERRAPRPVCDGSDGEIDARDELTVGRLVTLCPGIIWGQPNNHVKFAFVNPSTGKGGHCGGNPAKTEQLQLSVANGLFGGHDTPPVETASIIGRDCSAYCILNSEGRGHFKFNSADECFEYRGGGMCGNDEDKEYAQDRKAQLCTPDKCKDRKCKSGQSGNCRKYWFWGKYKCEDPNGGVCASGYTDCTV